ncbi:MAG: hypothetical protein FWC97_04575 [Treponema sp.]|nr:hypothetical protein [Treponema sp.]
MKRIVFALAIALMVSGVVWGQGLPGLNDFDNYFNWNFNAVQTESIESRFTAQVFNADMDLFVDPTFYNPDIGTFVFLGGFQNDNPNSTISFGFGRTLGDNILGASYIGVYYAGSFFNVDSRNTEISDGVRTVTSISWNNYLAVLFGIAGMGFRLDLIMNDIFGRTTFDGTVTASEARTGDTSIALGWGQPFGNFSPWARIGYKFPRTVTTTNRPLHDGVPTLRMVDSREAMLGFQFGALYTLTDVDFLVAEANLMIQFPDEVSGDAALIGSEPHRSGGGWTTNLYVHYERQLEIRRMTFGIKPRLSLDYYTWSLNNTLEGSPEHPRPHWLRANLGLDVGARYRFDKLALYTGFSLDLFDFRSLLFSGGDDANRTDASHWSIRGISWIDYFTGAATANPFFRFGLTFTPVEGLVIGAGLEALLGQLFIFNLRNMEFSSLPNINAGDRTNDIFHPNARFQVTVSYTF